MPTRSRELALRRQAQQKAKMLTTKQTRESIIRRQKAREARGQVKRHRIGSPVRVPLHRVASALNFSRITCITPTGDRPLAFALCQQWMKHQTVKPDQWIVVDDGKIPLTPTYAMQYVRREPRPGDPEHTLVLNMQAALPMIQGDNILIIEDDEYYAPGYVAAMSNQLGRHEVAGIGMSRYYHLSSAGYFTIGNMNHASLAQTGFRKSFVPHVRKILDMGKAYIDFHIWEQARRVNHGGIFTDTANPLYVGMKGLPGRVGIGRGHDPRIYRFQDTDRKVLRQWIPKDYQVYLDIISGKLTSENCRSYFPADFPITGITVCWNTKDLIERAYNSIRKFYPEMPIIIIDGSDAGNPCATYVRGLSSSMTTIIQPGYNIGHGQGMCLGIDKAKTPYALIFDSDIVLMEDCLSTMLEKMGEDSFGIGEVMSFSDKCVQQQPMPTIPYLHPRFHLIDVRNYKKFRPYIHHGAPCLATMIDIHRKGLSTKVLIDFPIDRYIHHIGRGTRKICPDWREMSWDNA